LQNLKIKRKEFEKEFLIYNKSGKQIWVINKVKELPTEIVTMAKNLADLEFIIFIRITDESVAASSENYPIRPKVPLTQMDHATATGIHILYSTEYKTLDFFDINSPIKGNGSKMVDAIFKDLPGDWQPAVVMDWSDGFWDKVKVKYINFKWLT
jgi:hypothetical protein